MDETIAGVTETEEVTGAATTTHPGVRGTWMFPFLYGVLVVMASLFWLSRGRFFDRTVYLDIADIPWEAVEDTKPAVARLVSVAVRLCGALGIGAGIVISGVAATGYRRGQRWAWYVLWALPLYATLDLSTLAAYRALTVTVAAWDIFLLALALAGLLIPYRAFFEAPPRR